MNFFKKPKIF